MSAEAEAEAMSMPYPDRAPNGFLEAMDAGCQGGADVQTEAMAMVAPLSVEARKANLPALDLLHWSEAPYPNPNRPRFSATNDSSAFMNASDERPFLQPPVVRTSQPAGGISTISFGANLTLEESEQLQRRRPGSDSKRKEMRGSRIFEQETELESTPDLLAKKALAMAGFSTPQRASSNANTEGLDLSPKKALSLSEVAKQRELSGTFYGATDTPGSRRPNSSAKSRELEGSNIFGQLTEDQLNVVAPKWLATGLNKAAEAKYQETYVPPRTSVKVSNPAGGRSQISLGCDGGGEQQFCTQRSKKHDHNQKAAELIGHNILRGEGDIASSNNDDGSETPSERNISAAKRREMLGNDIFSDVSSVVTQVRPRRTRQPPGGDSSLKLF